MLFLVDACYGGLAAVGTRSLEPTNIPNYLEKISNIKSRQIITAGGKEEKVVEKSEWGHSAYTKNLLSGLNDELADVNEDGYITALELGSYLSEKVTFDSESQQTPQLRRLTSDEGEFVFFGTKKTQIETEVSLLKDKEDETLKEELFESYEYNTDLIKDYKKYKRQEIIKKLVNNSPNSTHSFFLNGYQYNKLFLSNKELNFSLLALNELVYAFAVGTKYFKKEERIGLYWGYNLLLLGKLKEEGYLAPLSMVYVGNKGFIPNLEFGYRLRWIDSIKYGYGIIGTKKRRLIVRLFYITAKINLYILKDENGLFKNIELYSNIGMEFPINWWRENIK
jgi:hypothetical protein